MSFLLRPFCANLKLTENYREAGELCKSLNLED